MLNRSERVTPSRPAAPPPPLRKMAAPTEDRLSTISKSKSVVSPFVPSKPILDPPPPVWSMLGEVGRLENAAYTFTLQKEQRIDSIFNQIKRLQLEEGLKLEETYAASEDMTFWGYLYDIGSAIMSSVSFFFGFAAVSSGGTLVGAALLTSGILSLTNIAFKHAQAWDWIADQVSNGDRETREAVKTYLPAAVGIAATAMGLYGAYGAWNFPQLQGTAKGLAILETTAGVAQAIASWNNGQAGHRFRSAGAEVSALQTKTELTTLELDVVIDDIKKFQKELGEVQELIGRLVQDTSHSIQSIQQPV